MGPTIRILSKAAGGLIVLVGSFGITLMILDRVKAGSIFSMALRGTPNWHVDGRDITTNTSGSGVVVQSTVANPAYQLVTNDISLTNPAKPYLLDYDIRIGEGAVGIGVLDSSTKKWVITYPLTQPTGRSEFATQAKNVSLVVYNNSAGPSQITIARLALSQK